MYYMHTVGEEKYQTFTHKFTISKLMMTSYVTCFLRFFYKWKSLVFSLPASPNSSPVFKNVYKTIISFGKVILISSPNLRTHDIWHCIYESTTTVCHPHPSQCVKSTHTILCTTQFSNMDSIRAIMNFRNLLMNKISLSIYGQIFIFKMT